MNEQYHYYMSLIAESDNPSADFCREWLDEFAAWLSETGNMELYTEVRKFERKFEDALNRAEDNGRRTNIVQDFIDDIRQQGASHD